MKNYEKYADEIKNYNVNEDECFCGGFIMPHILKKDRCSGWTSRETYAWKYAKLAESEEE